VISRLDEEVLKAVALASGGSYARFDDRAALETMTRALANLQARTLASQPATEPRERYQWPLCLAIILLLGDALLGMGRAVPPPRAGGVRPVARTPARILAVTGGMAAVLLLLSCTSAQRNVTRGQQLYDNGRYLEAYEAYQTVLRQQGGPEVRYNAGNSLYRLKQYSEASKMYRDALGGGSDRLRGQTYFNMGNSFVRAAEDANALSGYLERATEAYEEALHLNPDDKDAKWNLEIALARGGDPGQQGSRGLGGRADYGRGGREEGYEGNRESAVGAMAGGGSGGDEGESVEELDEEQARSLLESVERQQLSTHEGHRNKSGEGGGRDW
jgi:tetratricopeptide (TPR) repeat protein